MSYGATVFNVMTATPGDVQEERTIIREVLHEWNATHSKASQVVLMPIAWDTHAAPSMGERPQEIINKQILRDCDVLVAVFWTRIGTDTGKAPSGTVEEIREHLAEGKPAMLYFSNTPIKPGSVESAQYEALRAFKKQCQSQGLIEEYGTLDEFRHKFTRQLQTVIQGSLQPSLPAPETLLHQISVRSGLSEEAKTLLLTAVQTNGHLMHIRTLSGTVVQAGPTNLCKGNSPREAAKWEAALDELLTMRLIADKGHKGEVFAVTHLGFQMADQLKNQ
jgi:hypothetical protein